VTKKIENNSLDIINKEINKLKLIFPNIIKEGKVDLVALQKIFGENIISSSEEKYCLDWADKFNSFKEIQKQTINTLIPDKKNSIKFEKSKNIFIEGENLEVLKILQRSYYGKIKMIYIDPPYNTGNDSFIYPDDYSETKEEYMLRTGRKDESGFVNKEALFKKNIRENGHYHSAWLSMMYPRIHLARNLLTEDGSIFVSIDDNEMANLKLLMDEIFGEENFLGTITVMGNPRGRDYGGIAKMHDYLLVYSKSHQTDLNNLNQPNKEFDYEDSLGGFDIRELRNRNIAFNSENRPNLYYPFYINPKKELDNGFLEISLAQKKGWKELYPKESQGFKTVWRWARPLAQKNLNVSIVGKEMNDGGYQIVEKYREKTKMARSIWLDKDVNTEKGTLTIKDLFKKKIFSFPKPVGLIKRCIEMGTSDNDIVLDFFSGSGTTAEAVIELNEENVGNRQFILIQMPEKCDEDSEAYKAGYKYISDITKERIKLVLKKYEKEDKNKLQFEEKNEDGFKAFKLSTSNFRIWNSDLKANELVKQLELHKNPILKEDEENILYEILIKTGLMLSVKIDKIIIQDSHIYNIQNGELIIAINSINKLILKEVISIKPRIFICLDKLFESNDHLKTNIKLQLKDNEIEFQSI